MYNRVSQQDCKIPLFLYLGIFGKILIKLFNVYSQL